LSNLEQWAEFVAALSPDSEEARAFARAQCEIGFPDPFRPRCDNGLFMRTYGLADQPPPSPGTLRELVALEGLDEPLPPGAIFPMDPTPVRDGLPLWEVEAIVLSDDPGLSDAWPGVRELEHPRFEGVADDYFNLPRRPEDYPPPFLEGGLRTAIAAIGKTRCVEIPLQAPLGERDLIDGVTGQPPGPGDEFDPSMRFEEMARVDIDRLPVQPLP
jgi:hypothetical protein